MTGERSHPAKGRPNGAPGGIRDEKPHISQRKGYVGRPGNTQWQRDLSVSHNKIGDVLVAQGDGAGALAAYRKGLVIAEALAERDPANTQWQADVAVSCSKLGTVEHGISVDERLRYLLRGRDTLLRLKSAGRLLPQYDWISWFGQKPAELDRKPE